MRNVAALSGTPYTTLWMRIVSLCVYLVACAIAIKEPSIFDGNGETARKRAARLIACSTACLFISLAGSLGFIYGAKGALALACGFAMKLFGAPLTIALVCCYSRIKKADSTKASLIGISGAFVAQSILSSINVQQLWHPLIGICAGFALCAVAIICIAALLCTEAPKAAHAPSGTQLTKSQPNESRNQLPLRNVFTGPFLAILVSTSFMLGFLRSGLQTNDALSASPFIAIALVAFCVLLIPTDAHVSLSNLLSVGLACVAAAFLVAPLIDSTVPDCQTILATLGTTVLEAAAWAMAASAARQSRKTLVAAAFARLCVAFGHLLGALIARSMLVLSNADASAIQAGSLVVIFVDFMVALFLGRGSTEAFVQIRKGINRTRNRQSGFRARRNRNAHWHGKRYMRPQRERGRSRTLWTIRMQNFARSLLRPAKHKRAQLRVWNSMPYATTARSAHSKLSRTHANLPRARSRCLGSCHSAGISQL